MKERLRRYCLALALLLGLVSVSSTADAGEYRSKDTTNYVILVDTSGVESDGTAAIETCSLLTELTADGSAQIGVIAYGYEGSKSDIYPYSHYTTPRYESQLIHLLLPLEEIGSSTEAKIRQSVRTAFDFADKRSPHGQALLAAVDLLKFAETPSGQGCIILISDGIRATEDFLVEEQSRTTAITDAASCSWPIYTLQLSRAETDPAQDADATAMMEMIAAESGAEVKAGIGQESDVRGAWKIPVPSQEKGDSVGEMPISEFHRAVMQILMKKAPDVKIPRNGSITASYQVSNLTCMRVLGFSGQGLRSVTVGSDSISTQTFTESTIGEFVSVVFGESYIVVRLNAPLPELWTVTVNTDGSEKVFLYDMTLSAPDIALSAKIDQTNELASSEDYSLVQERERSISFQSTYSYHGMPLEICGKDESVTAQLQIQAYDLNETKQYKEVMVLKLDPQRMGHISKDIMLDMLLDKENERYGYKTGRYRARVVLTRDQEPQFPLHSDWFYFAANDPVCKWVGEKVLEAKCSANGVFEIHLKGNLETQDKDKLEFTLIDHNNDGVKFVFLDKDGNESPVYQGNPDHLKIKASEYMGDFEVTLNVSDGSHNETVQINVTVENPAGDTTAQGITPVNLYEDSYFFYFNPKAQTISLDSGVTKVTLKDGYDSDVVECTYDSDNNQITFLAKTPGDTTLEIELEYSALTVDKYGDYVPDTKTKTFEVHVASASGIRNIFISVSSILLIGAICILIWYFNAHDIHGNVSCQLYLENTKGTNSACRVTIQHPTWPQKITHAFASVSLFDAIDSCFSDKNQGSDLRGIAEVPQSGEEMLNAALREIEKVPELAQIKICGVWSEDNIMRIIRMPEEFDRSRFSIDIDNSDVLSKTVYITKNQTASGVKNESVDASKKSHNRYTELIGRIRRLIGTTVPTKKAVKISVKLNNPIDGNDVLAFQIDAHPKS